LPLISTISTAELVQKIGDPQIAIVDLRPIASYNGWQLQDEDRGGHILGAVACPQSWSDHLSLNEMQTLLAAKNVVPEQEIVVYDYEFVDVETWVRRFLQQGYKDVKIYKPGFQAWAGDPKLPVQRLAHYESLVHPQWVNGLISNQEIQAPPQNSFVLCHVTSGGSHEYEEEHIPGAIHLNTNDLEDTLNWNRRSPVELVKALTAHGIAWDTTVVVYGRDSKPSMPQAHTARQAGQIAAARAAVILMYAGVKDVRLLDGGFDAWQAAGFEGEKGRRDPVPVPEFRANLPLCANYFIDIDEARSLLADPQGVLVSVRSWDEFTGNTSGYDFIGSRGHIPGAVWGNGGSDPYHMQHYRNVDNTMREYHEIEVTWQTAGITPDKRVAFYCGTGWRASEAFFYAYLLGWPDVAVFDGGWYEWSADPGNPIETGSLKQAG
jgi:molybdopterin synthase sulfurtransferase